MPNMELNSEKRIRVRIPDMFTNFCSRTPSFCPYYEALKDETNTWLPSLIKITDQQKKVLRVGNFPMFAALLVPDAGLEQYRVVSNWTDWVFTWDDLWDDGNLKNNRIKTRDLIDSLLFPMEHDIAEEDNTERTGLLKCHDDVWYRIKAKSSRTVQKQYMETVRAYLVGITLQAEYDSAPSLLGPDKLLELRARTIGAQMCLPLIAYAHGFEVPEEVYNHWILRRLECLHSEIIAIQNDVCSYQKEEPQSHKYNFIMQARLAGMGAQQAFDYAGILLQLKYTECETLAASLPDWNGEYYIAAQSLIEAMRLVVLANLYWSFDNGRYFGDRSSEVRRTRTIEVLENLPTAKNGYNDTNGVNGTDH